MGGGSPILVTLPAGSSTTTNLLATGGKQGNGYLVNDEEKQWSEQSHPQSEQ